MFEVQLPALKKYQHIAGITAGVGFVLGMLIPAFAIFTARWACPFGDGLLRIGGFLLLTGLGCAIVFGNLVAVFLMGLAKMKRRRANRALSRAAARRGSRKGKNTNV